MMLLTLLGGLAPRRLGSVWPARALGGPLATLARRGHEARSFVVAEADRVVNALVALAIRRVLDQLDLTALVRERVDLDAVAGDLDVDAVVAKADLDRVVARVDIDRIIDRVDIDRIIDRVDIDRIIDRVDIDGIIDRVDIDGIIDRVDLERIVDRLDVNAVAAGVDLDAIVARLDLIGLADYVVDGIDLPGIVRESSGMMASETLSGVRLQSLQADEAVSRAMSRWIPGRRGARSTAAADGAETGGELPEQRARTERLEGP